MVPPTFRPGLSTSVKAIKIIPHRQVHKPAWCRLSLTGIIFQVILGCVTRTNISHHRWLLGLVSKWWCLKQLLKKNMWCQEQRVLPLLSVYPPFSWDQHREYSKGLLLQPSNIGLVAVINPCEHWNWFSQVHLLRTRTIHRMLCSLTSSGILI